ncbi:MAG TPA: hypothetical protein VIF10_15310 [Methylobacter sp.]|jgi:hypothetical protein
MKISKYFLIPAAVLALSLSEAAIAKQPNNHGNDRNDWSGPDARLLNSNKQPETGDSFRGRDRADERQEINDFKDHDNFDNSNKAQQQSRHKR